MAKLIKNSFSIPKCTIDGFLSLLRWAFSKKKSTAIMLRINFQEFPTFFYMESLEINFVFSNFWYTPPGIPINLLLCPLELISNKGGRVTKLFWKKPIMFERL